MTRFKGKFLDSLGNGFILFINAVPAAVYYLFVQFMGTSTLGISMLYDESKWITWILPAISMSLGGIASYAMWTRRYMVDQLNQDYVRLARAKGLTEKQIMVKHVLRNAFCSVGTEYSRFHPVHNFWFLVYRITVFDSRHRRSSDQGD